MKKKPMLFYWEEAVDSWVPWPDEDPDFVLSYLDSLDDGEHMELRIKRIDMTDQELEALPEA